MLDTSRAPLLPARASITPAAVGVGEFFLLAGFRRRPLHPIYTQPGGTGRHRAPSNGQSNTLTWANWTEQHREYTPHDPLKVAARVRIPLGLLMCADRARHTIKSPVLARARPVAGLWAISHSG